MRMQEKAKRPRQVADECSGILCPSSPAAQQQAHLATPDIVEAGAAAAKLQLPLRCSRQRAHERQPLRRAEHGWCARPGRLWGQQGGCTAWPGVRWGPAELWFSSGQDSKSGPGPQLSPSSRRALKSVRGDAAAGLEIGAQQELGCIWLCRRPWPCAAAAGAAPPHAPPVLFAGAELRSPHKARTPATAPCAQLASLGRRTSPSLTAAEKQAAACSSLPSSSCAPSQPTTGEEAWWAPQLRLQLRLLRRMPELAAAASGNRPPTVCQPPCLCSSLQASKLTAGLPAHCLQLTFNPSNRDGQLGGDGSGAGAAAAGAAPADAGAARPAALSLPHRRRVSAAGAHRLPGGGAVWARGGRRARHGELTEAGCMGS